MKLPVVQLSPLVDSMSVFQEFSIGQKVGFSLLLQ
jgi:hypothetical protein